MEQVVEDRLGSIRPGMLCTLMGKTRGSDYGKITVGTEWWVTDGIGMWGWCNSIVFTHGLSVWNVL